LESRVRRTRDTAATTQGSREGVRPHWRLESWMGVNLLPYGTEKLLRESRHEAWILVAGCGTYERDKDTRRCKLEGTRSSVTSVLRDEIDASLGREEEVS